MEIATNNIAPPIFSPLLTKSIWGCLRTGSWVANRSTRRLVAGHAASVLGRFPIDVDIVMRRSKDFDWRVTTGVPVDGNMINSGDLFDVFRYHSIGPSECKVRHAIVGHLRWYNTRITLSHRIRRNRKGGIVLEVDLESILAGVIDVLFSVFFPVKMHF